MPKNNTKGDDAMSTNKLRKILELSLVPEGVIQELENKPPEYRTLFLGTIETIMHNEVINLIAFMEARDSIQKKFATAKDGK